MTDQECMQVAIEEAKKSSEWLPCGVVIIRDNKILTQAHNLQHSVNDATAHAEIIAIREGGKLLLNKNLENATIYCTCEPCTMCLTAIAFAKIPKIIYGANMADVTPKDTRIDILIDDFLQKSPRKIEIMKNFMLTECMELYRKYD